VSRRTPAHSTLLLSRALGAGRLAWSAAPGPAAATIALAVLTGAIPVASGWCLKVLLDELVHGRAANVTLVEIAAAGLAVAAVVIAVATNVAVYVATLTRRRLRVTIQERLFDRVNAFPGLAPFEDPVFLDRLRLAVDAGQRVPEEVLSSAINLMRNGVQLLGFLLTLLAIWPPVLAVLAVAAIPTILLQLALGRRRAQLAADIAGRGRRQGFYRYLLTDVRSAKEIRLFAIGSFLRRRMSDELRAATKEESAVDAWAFRVETGLKLIAGLVMLASVGIAAHLGLRGTLSVGDVSIFLAAVGGAEATVAGVASLVAMTYQGLMLFGNFEALMTDRSADTMSGLPPAPALRIGIELRDVWFRYGPDRPWVLHGVSFTMPAGSAVGLVGVNGAGKSTIVKLLCRLYEPEKGQVLWDGVDVRELDVASLREHVGAVFQDFMAYDLTAAENIGIGKLDHLHDLDKIRTAAADAGVDGGLSALSGGYATLLSRTFRPRSDEVGTSALSGGQWQRVAVARAFLRTNADLLILDEPSAGLDAAAEAALHQRLRTLRRGRTALLISHRLGGLRDADQIVVIDGGRVVECGSHDELTARSGVYARLYSLQAAAYSPAAG